jgi:hypothetical protein
MEHKFALFVACATIVAHQQLGLLREKWGTGLDITREVLSDAARFACNATRDRLFPGLVRLPFDKDPTPEIILALRYQYEHDPEGIGSTLPREDESSRRRSLSDTRAPGVRTSQANVPKLPMTGPSDTSRRRTISGGIVPTPLNQHPGTQDPSGRRSGVTPIPGAETLANQSSTKLQKISGAPVFPWEKRR